MKEYTYELVLTEEHQNAEKQYTGKLFVSWKEFDEDLFIYEDRCKEITIDLFNVLGDLKYHPPEHQSENGFDNSFPLYIENPEDYVCLVQKLNSAFLNKLTSPADLTALQKAYSLTLTYDIKTKDNFSHKLLNKFYTIKKDNKLYIKSKHISPYTTLEYKNGEDNALLSQNLYMDESHQFCYYCNNMTEVIFSILHFLVLHKFKFKTCTLCKKMYARPPKQGQSNGCTRLCPFSLEELLTTSNCNLYKKDPSCKMALKYGKKQIQDYKNDIINNIDINHPNLDTSSFKESLKPYETALKDNPCFENLKSFILYLNQDNRKIWYE